MPCVFILWIFPVLWMVKGFDLDQETPLGDSVRWSISPVISESHILRPEVSCSPASSSAHPGRVTPGRPGTRHSPLGLGQPAGTAE